MNVDITDKPSPFNYDELLLRANNDPKLVQELLLIFKEDLPIHVRELLAAVAVGDSQRVAVVSHTLKGVLANLAASPAAAGADRLEQLGRRSSSAEELNNALFLFEAALAELLPHIRACMEKSQL